MTAAVYQPPPCDAERERIRELSRYYCVVDRPQTTTTANVQAPQGDEQPDGNPRLAADIALTALAQLGVLRFGCNRSFVSIIDGASQHIIAEATASVSLRDVNQHEPSDGIYLGTRTLDLVWGVCPHTIKLFTGRDASYALDTDNITANHSRYIIRDFTQEDCFKDRPYVVGWPHMRFYAEVPLRSPAGYVLGSYCIVDDKPWSHFGDREVSILQEFADAIASHLETTRISHCHRRTETLVKSLTSFVKDHAEFDPSATYQPTSPQAGVVSTETVEGPSQSDEDSLVGSVLTSPNVTLEDVYDHVSLGQRSPSDATGELSLFSKVMCSDKTDLSTPTPPQESFIPTVSLNQTQGPNYKGPSNPPLVDKGQDIISKASLIEPAISESITRIFARASLLLRDSMDLEGVSFLDASRCNSGVVMSGDTGPWEPLPSTANPEFFVDPYHSPVDMSGVGSLSNAAERPCALLGTAHRGRPRSGPESNPEPHFTGRLLNLMIATFPQGQIINLRDYREDLEDMSHELDDILSHQETDAVNEICHRLAEQLPDADWVLFSPLWDWNKSRWLAGTLVWTRNSFRALGEEELHYFKIFGDSIISEVARVDWATTEKSKSDFMSSVSHELRSPLHGILASTELLGSTGLPSDQQDLVKMVETCGLTLLDTLNHLLDFSKINNLTTADDLDHADLNGNVTHLTGVFELDTLVEDVVNVQYSGRRIPLNVPHLLDKPQTYPTPVSTPPSDEGELTVVVRVKQPHTWKLQSVPGAWKRIVMNLLGNSLKWTKSGFVEVALSKAKRQADQLSAFVQLSVTDTGCGISPDFLKHRLFSPFTQESSLSEGLGLGLSIVHQLVTSLGGHINVRSEVGIGTQVDIYIPVQMFGACSTERLDNPLFEEWSSPTARTEACLIGFTGHPDLQEPPTGILPAEAKRKLAVRGCVTTVLDEEPDWSLCLVDSVENAKGDVAIIEEAKFGELLTDGRVRPEIMARTGFKFFIVLDGNDRVLTNIKNSNVVRVSQPFGYSKLRDTIARVRKLYDEIPPESVALPTETETTSPGIPISEPGPQSASTDPGNKLSETRTPTPSIPPALENPINLHLLIVDDNAINLKILATFSRKIGCTYDTASDGLIAFNKYTKSPRRYDLVLMDISMPVMDGIMSTSKIRQYEKEQNLKPSRIMAVTGVGSTDMQQRAHAAGIDEYLVKPVSLQALKKAISSL